jgi:hypothetical protein
MNSRDRRAQIIISLISYFFYFLPHNSQETKMDLLIERYADKIAGTLSCYNRVVIIGTLPQICYAAGIASWLYVHKIRIFDYHKILILQRNIFNLRHF